MRIACIHIPQLSLQCAIRVDPALRGAPLAVVGARVERTGPLHAPLVVACSRAAWALGIRLGMTATAARAIAGEATPALQVVQVDPGGERETVRAIADAVIGAVPGRDLVVDTGGRVGVGGAHLAMYAEVPAKTRGASFGERVLELLDELGLSGRVGIADDRFTAWVAAAYGGERRGDAPARPGEPADDVISVPRGGSAAFLAPRPLGLLAIPAEVQHMLESLGVKTLGEFAALPAPSVARPLEADYQALARGDSGSALRPYAPEAPVREDIAITSGNGLALADLLPVHERAGALSGPAAIALIARRIGRRLAGRGRLAARFEVTTIAAVTPTLPAARETREVTIQLAQPTGEADDLARALAPAIAAAPEGPWRLRVVVSGEAIAGEAAAAPTSIYEAPARELAVVLATPGSLLALSAPGLGERRDEHRRTRRGKQRRTRPAPAVVRAQARLFERG